MGILKIHSGRRITKKIGLPISTFFWEYMIIKPTLDEAGDAVTPSGAFTKSEDQLDGPILSIRASILKAFQTWAKRTVWVTAGSGK